MHTHKFLVTTHAHKIYLLSLSLPDPANTPTPAHPSTPRILASLILPEQPSYAVQHPQHAELVYVTCWVDNKVFLIRLLGDGVGHGDGDEAGIEGEVGFEVLEERGTGGQGPTYFVMTEGGDGLLIVHSEEADRQASSHPHHLVLIPRQSGSSETESDDAGRDYLVPDLGGDKIFVVRFSRTTGWEIRSTTSVTAGNGPRHLLLRTTANPKEHLIYLVNELSNLLTIHLLTVPSQPSEPPTISQALAAHPTLPPALQIGGEKGYAPKGPYEAIACTILEGGEGEVLVSNRNVDKGVAEEGDSVIVFPGLIKPEGTIPNLEAGKSESDSYHLFGAGRHLRAMSLDPSGSWLIAASREGDGLTMYHKSRETREAREGDRWQEVMRGGLKGEMDLPVGFLFLR